MKIGDKIKMCAERTRYTVQGFDERFIIATKPHFGTYIYTIIDKEERIRGPINMIFGPPDDVNSPEGAAECLRFMREEDGGHETWHVSRRNYLPLTDAEIAQARNDALREAARVCTGDEERPDTISPAKLRKMPAPAQFAYEAKRLAWVDADAILALIKEPTT